jgi:DNA polymerase V
VAGLHQIYRPGCLFIKAGVMLLSLQDQATQQDELDLWAAPTLGQRQQLMGTIDRINARWGRGTLALGRAHPECQTPSPQAAVQAQEPSPPAWAMRQRWKSPEYTTRWDQIKEVRS